MSGWPTRSHGAVNKRPVGHGRFQEIAERVIDAKTEHGALAVARDLCEFVHHVVHALRARGREEHAHVVDAEIVVDDPRGDDLAIRENLRTMVDFTLSVPSVGLKCEDALANRQNSASGSTNVRTPLR